MTQPVPPGMSGIPVRAPDGQAGTVPAEQLDAALARGFRPLSPDELQAEQDREEAEARPEGQIVAGLRGALRAVPGYDAAVIGTTRLLQGDDAAKLAARSLKASEAAYPTTSTAAEIGGMLAPVAAIEAVGARAASLAGRVLPRATGIVARTAVTTAAQAAAEGAIYGAGAGLDETMLGDPEANAEKLLASAGKGALFGAGAGAVLGGVLGAAGGYVSREAGAMSDALRERRPLTGAEAEAEAVAHKAGTATDTSAWDEAFARSQGPAESAADSAAAAYVAKIEDPERRKAAQVAYDAAKNLGDAEDAVQAATKRTTTAGDTLLGSVQRMRRTVFGDAKAALVGQMIEADAPSRAKALGAMFALRDTARDELSTVAKWLGKGEGNVAIQNALGHLDRFDERMAGTIRAGSAELNEVRDAYVLLDRFKQSLGHEAGYGLESITEGQKRIRDIYERTRKLLEDASLWGERTAKAQQTVNAATSHMLQTNKSARAAFVDASKVVAGDVVLRADPAKLKSLLENANDVSRSRVLEDIEGFIAGHEEQIAAARAHLPLTAEDHAAMTEGEKAIQAFRAEIAQSVATADAALAAKRALERERAGAIGGLVSGLTLDAVTRPVTTAQRLGEIARAARAIDDRIASGVERFLKRGPNPRPAASVSAKEAAAAGEEAARLAANPAVLTARVEKMLGGLSEHAPQTATILASKATRIATYLASVAPKAKVTAYTLTPQAEKPRYAEADASRFARTLEGAKDPVGFLESGHITREGVQAIRELYPRIYQEMRRHVVEQLAARTTPLPYEQRIALGMMLGITTDPTLDPAFVAAVQAAKAQPAPQQPSGGVDPQSIGRKARPLKTDGMMSASDQIAARTAGG